MSEEDTATNHTGTYVGRHHRQPYRYICRKTPPTIQVHMSEEDTATNHTGTYVGRHHRQPYRYICRKTPPPTIEVHVPEEDKE